MFGTITESNPESAARPADMIGRWDNYSYGNSNQINAGTAAMAIGNGGQPILLKHLRLRKFQAVFSLQLQRTGDPTMQFIFNATDNEDGDSINFALSQARAPWGLETDTGNPANVVSGTYGGAAFTPLTDTTSTIWGRVTNDGTAVSVQWSADVPSAVAGHGTTIAVPIAVAGRAPVLGHRRVAAMARTAGLSAAVGARRRVSGTVATPIVRPVMSKNSTL